MLCRFVFNAANALRIIQERNFQSSRQNRIYILPFVQAIYERASLTGEELKSHSISLTGYMPDKFASSYASFLAIHKHNLLPSCAAPEDLLKPNLMYFWKE